MYIIHIYIYKVHSVRQEHCMTKEQGRKYTNSGDHGGSWEVLADLDPPWAHIGTTTFSLLNDLLE